MVRKRKHRGILLKFRSALAGFLAVGHSWDLGSEKKWYKTCSDKPGDRTAAMMILQFHTESCHPIFRVPSVFKKKKLRKQWTWQEVYQFTENKGNIELFLCTVISVNQLSIHGAIADLCKELNEDSNEDSYEDPESSGTFDTEEGPNEMGILCGEYIMP